MRASTQETENGGAGKTRASLLRRILYFALFLILATSPTQYAFEIRPGMYLSIVDPLIWITAALLALDVLITKRLRRIQYPPVIMVLFVLLAVLSIVRASAPFTAVKDAIQYVEYFVVGYILFADVIRTSGRLRRFVFWFLGISTVVIVLGAVQYFRPETADFDVSASFGNRNVFGGYLSICLPLAFATALYDPVRLRRLWLWALTAAGLGVVLSGAAFLAVSAALLFTSMVKGRKAFALTAVILLAGAIFVLPRMPRDNARKMYESVSLYGPEGRTAKRYGEWQAAAAMAGHNPLLGVGVGNYQANIGQYYGTIPNPPVPAEPDSQNLYLVLASSIGLPGLVCLAGMLILFMVKSLRAFGSAAGVAKGVALGAGGSVLAFALNSVWSPLLVRGLGIPLVFVLTLIALLQQKPADAE
ncbi:MAG: O-antigen ligase family protein [Kiritimatiellia bacterium]